MNKLEEQVRIFYSQIWDQQNYLEMANVLHSNFVFRGSLGQEKHGHEGFKEYALSVHSGLSEYKCTVEELVIQDQKVFAKMTFSGFHSAPFMGYAATNQQVSWAGAALFTFEDDKVACLWVLGDVINLQRQLEESR